MYLEIFKLKKFFILSLLIFFIAVFLLDVQIIWAADLSDLSDQMSRMKVSTPSNHTIEFTTPSGVGAGETITLEFPACFSMPAALDYTDMDLADDGADLDLAATCSGATWGVSVSGHIITFTSCTGTIAATSVVTIEIGTNAMHQTAGDQQIVNCDHIASNVELDIDGSMADLGTIGLGILSEDQIAVTGTLLPTLSFTLDTSALDFGLVLTSSVAGAGPNTMVLATNSPLGYTIAVRDVGNGTSAGLWNSAKNHLIPSTSGLLIAGTSEGYGGQCTKIGGSGACHANFNFTGDNVGDFARTNQVFANYGAAPPGAETFTITVKAAVVSNTPSGEYLDRLIFTATAIY